MKFSVSKFVPVDLHKKRKTDRALDCVTINFEQFLK